MVGNYIVHSLLKVDFNQEETTLVELKKMLNKAAGKLNNEEIIIQYHADGIGGHYYGDVELKVYANGLVKFSIETKDKIRRTKFNLKNIYLSEGIELDVRQNTFQYSKNLFTLQEQDQLNAIAAIICFAFDKIDYNNSRREKTGPSIQTFQKENANSSEEKLIKRLEQPISSIQELLKETGYSFYNSLPTTNTLEAQVEYNDLLTTIKGYLTEKEYKCFIYLIEGFTDKNISELIGIPRTTWNYQKKKLLRKLQIIIKKEWLNN